MDPTIRQAIRDFVVDAATPDEPDGSPAIDDETRDALLARVPLPELHPHVVKLAAAVVKVDKKTGDRQHAGPLICPDCGRGLVSRGTDLICSQLPMATAPRGDLDAGRIVACGEGLADG